MPIKVTFFVSLIFFSRIYGSVSERPFNSDDYPITCLESPVTEDELYEDSEQPILRNAEPFLGFCETSSKCEALEWKDIVVIHQPIRFKVKCSKGKKKRPVTVNNIIIEESITPKKCGKMERVLDVYCQGEQDAAEDDECTEDDDESSDDDSTDAKICEVVTCCEDDSDETTKNPCKILIKKKKKKKSKICKRHNAPIKKWGRWGKWSACSVTCGVGKTMRLRYCLSNNCTTGEKEVQSRTCTLPPCKHE